MQYEAPAHRARAGKAAPRVNYDAVDLRKVQPFFTAT